MSSLLKSRREKMQLQILKKVDENEHKFQSSLWVKNWDFKGAESEIKALQKELKDNKALLKWVEEQEAKREEEAKKRKEEQEAKLLAAKLLAAEQKKSPAKKRGRPKKNTSEGENKNESQGDAGEKTEGDDKAGSPKK